MEKLSYCLKCYADLEEAEWETVVLLESLWVFRCPRCKSVHIFGSHGSVTLSTNK